MSDVEAFRSALLDAAARIAPPYFQLPVSGREEPAYRERVYAYELYHQLRDGWPEQLASYTLGGEVDKAGHPLIRGDDLDRAKPDLIVHVPGDMTQNLAVVEIKPATVDSSGIMHDLRKLAAFCDPARGRYAAGFFLVYGTAEKDVAALLDECNQARRQLDTNAELLYLIVQTSAATLPTVDELSPHAV